MPRYGINRYRTESANEIAELDRVWLAAVLDCEGTVSVRKANRHWIKNPYYGRIFAPWIEIDNNDPRLIEKVYKIAGVGKIVQDKRTNQPLHWTMCFSWRLYAMYPMKQILEQLLPYLIVKKQNAEVLLAYLRLRMSHLEKESKVGKIPKYTCEEEKLVNDLRLLNRKGTFISEQHRKVT